MMLHFYMLIDVKYVLIWNPKHTYWCQRMWIISKIRCNKICKFRWSYVVIGRCLFQYILLLLIFFEKSCFCFTWTITIVLILFYLFVLFLCCFFVCVFKHTIWLFLFYCFSNTIVVAHYDVSGTIVHNGIINNEQQKDKQYLSLLIGKTTLHAIHSYFI